MAVQKYQVEKTTLDKIKKLFVCRRLSDLLKLSGLDQKKDFIADVINVQYQIYRLDGYLEGQWELSNKETDHLWEGIFISLRAMGYKEKAIKTMVLEIRDYEKIEKNCRKDKWPTKVSLKDFYVTKSCDVRLIRKLIYHGHPELSERWKEKSWKYFDIITEINDDIADIHEDILTYNGNRFLISILRKGADKTIQRYSEYLTDVTEKATVYFSDRLEEGSYKQLAGWTADRSLQTFNLLETLVKSKTMDQLSASLMLAKMK